MRMAGGKLALPAAAGLLALGCCAALVGFAAQQPTELYQSAFPGDELEVDPLDVGMGQGIIPNEYAAYIYPGVHGQGPKYARDSFWGGPEETSAGVSSIYSTLREPPSWGKEDGTDAVGCGDGYWCEDTAMRKVKRLNAEKSKLIKDRQEIIDDLRRQKDAAALKVAKDAVAAHRERLDRSINFLSRREAQAYEKYLAWHRWYYEDHQKPIAHLPARAPPLPTPEEYDEEHEFFNINGRYAYDFTNPRGGENFYPETPFEAPEVFWKGDDYASVAAPAASHTAAAAPVAAPAAAAPVAAPASAPAGSATADAGHQ